MKIQKYLRLVVFSHTIFALPFALMAMLVAAGGLPSLRVVLLILLCMVSARNSAMAFNRLVDRKYDAVNPRTAGRELVRGDISVASVAVFIVVHSAIFMAAAFFINPLAFALSPLALAVILLYSFTKRFTWLSHLVLGLCLAIAPLGAWIAVTGRIGLPSLVLSAAVVLWVAGFDILYSLQDISFDRTKGLFSLPAKWGIGPSLWASRGLHVGCVALLGAFGVVTGLSTVYFAGLLAVGMLLSCQHFLVRKGDLSKIGTAFFTVNGWVSFSMLVLVAVDIFTKR